MQRPDPTERRVLRVEIEDWIKELDRSSESDQHANKPKDDRCDDEGLYNLIVVTESFDFHAVLRVNVGPKSRSGGKGTS